MSFTLYNNANVTQVFLVGDSTMSEKELSAYPETGWGMPFAKFFDSTIVVRNHAKNGRSTCSFFEEKRWDAVLSEIQNGDIVFIQFGHNDEVKTKLTYTPENIYKDFLMKYVQESRAKGATAVLVTPVSRRYFDSTGTLNETHPKYSAIVREVAKDLSVNLIDLDKESIALFSKFGSENSKLLFNHLEPGQNPNYPDGKKDNTHFNELGARLVAELVLKEVKQQGLLIASHIRKPVMKKK